MPIFSTPSDYDQLTEHALAHGRLFSEAVMINLRHCLDETELVYQLSCTAAPRSYTRQQVLLTVMNAPYANKPMATLTLVENTPTLACYVGERMEMGRVMHYIVRIRVDVSQELRDKGISALAEVICRTRASGFFANWFGPFNLNESDYDIYTYEMDERLRHQEELIRGGGDRRLHTAVTSPQ
jgi:hypothetical protein